MYGSRLYYLPVVRSDTGPGRDRSVLSCLGRGFQAGPIEDDDRGAFDLDKAALP